MRFLSLLVFTFLLSACDDNPLGGNSISSCGHAPNASVGLPLTCPISLPASTGLFTWFDANDSGTVLLQNQIDLVSWLDLSGGGVNLNHIPATTAAVQKKKGTNDRNVLAFTATPGVYSAGGGLAGFPADQSFTLALSFRTAGLAASPLEITNNNGFALRIEAGGEITYTIGTLAISTGVLVAANSLEKHIVAYDSTTQLFSVSDVNGLLHSNTVTGTVNAWTDFQVTGNASLELNEILIYTEITNAQALQVYLNSKWGF